MEELDGTEVEFLSIRRTVSRRFRRSDFFSGPFSFSVGGRNVRVRDYVGPLFDPALVYLAAELSVRKIRYMRSLAKILATAVVFALAGCSHDEKISEQQSKAEAQIQHWVPIGTPASDAQHIMEQHHFTCSVMTNSNFGEVKAGDFLHCDNSTADDQVSPIVKRRCQAALVLNDGTVSAIHVNTGLVGP